ncbi:MAG: envelope stress response membrane protein PspC [Gammaproteobacteria bacterium]|nr:envelope stress response membrane protein PspC [Gammaproteobacteria bacterium]
MAPHQYRKDSPRHLYRDPEKSLILGVCAGLADYIGANRTAVRLAVCFVSIFFLPFAIFLYLLLGFILPRKPKDLYKNKEDEHFWREMRSSPSNLSYSVRHKFRELDTKLQRMERYVTSPRFKLDKEFRDLES